MNRKMAEAIRKVVDGIYRDELNLLAKDLQYWKERYEEAGFKIAMAKRVLTE